jgi:hypothetical protein
LPDIPRETGRVGYREGDFAGAWRFAGGSDKTNALIIRAESIAGKHSAALAGD